MSAAHNVQGAQESQGDAEGSRDNVRYAVRDGLLTPESTEAERYELLENIKLKVAQVNNDRITDVNLEDYNTRKKSAVEKGIKKLAATLGITNVDLENSWIDFPFSFTNKNLGISIHHQLDYGGTYQDYVKAMSCFDEIVENAVPIETHRDKKAGTSKANTDLKQVYVMLSAFTEGKKVSPVQLEIKEFWGSDNRLYMMVTLTKTNPEVLEAPAALNEGDPAPLFSGYTISLRQLIHNVNSNDYKFFKYIPDGFLNDEQLAAKERALREQDAEYAEYGTKRQACDADYLDAVVRNDMEQAQRMVTEYKGGHAAYPVAQDIEDEFVSEYKTGRPAIKYSPREAFITEEKQAEINAYVDKALTKGQRNEKPVLYIAPVSDRLVSDLSSQGVDVSGRAHYLNDNDVRHIIKSHGIKTQNSKSINRYGTTGEDIKAIPYIVRNYTEVYYTPKEVTGKAADGIVYRLDDVDTVYYVEQVMDGGGLFNKQLIKVPRGESANLVGLDWAIEQKKHPRDLTTADKSGLEVYARSAQGILSDEIIPQVESGVNKKLQARDADTISSREALANALETAAKNDLERGLLADYKKIIQSLNEDQENIRRYRHALL